MYPLATRYAFRMIHRAPLTRRASSTSYVVVGTVGTDHANGKPRNRLVVLHGGLVWAGYDKHFLRAPLTRRASSTSSAAFA